MPSYPLEITTHDLLDRFNGNELPEGPAAFVLSCITGAPDFDYMDNLRKSIKPLRYREQEPVDILDCLGIVGTRHDPIEIAIVGLFDYGDGASLLGARRCGECGRWGWFSGKSCC